MNNKVLSWRYKVLSNLFYTLLFLSSPIVNANNTVVFAESPWPPYVLGNVETGKVTGGTAIELVNVIFSQIEGVDVAFELMPWKRAIKEVKLGNKDAISYLQNSPERRQFLDFSLALTTSNTRLFYSSLRFPNGIEWQSFEDLKPYQIGVVAGYAADLRLQQVIANGAMLNIQKIVGNDHQLFDMLLRNRFDLFAVNEKVGHEFIRNNSWHEKIAASKKPLFEFVFHMGFSKKAKHGVLIKQVDEILQKMHAQGQVEAILN